MGIDREARQALKTELQGSGERVRALIDAAVNLSEGEVVALGRRIVELNAEALGNRETLSALTERFEGSKAGGRAGLDVAIRQQERSVDLFVGRVRDELRKQRDAGAAVVQVAVQIRRFVGSVETIAADMRMLTINAKLEAGRWGADGAAFATIAAGLRDLTTEVQRVNEQVGQHATTLGTFADRIAASERSAEQVVEQLQGEMAERLQNLVAAYEETRDASARAVSAGSERAERLVRMSTSMLTNLQFQDRMAQTLAEVNAVVAREHEFIGIVLDQVAANDNVDVERARRSTGLGLVRLSRESELSSSDQGQAAGVVDMF